MHDSFNGVIPKLCLSHDQRFLFSCGTDGNLFVFKLNLNEEFFLKFKPLPPKCIEVRISNVLIVACQVMVLIY